MGGSLPALARLAWRESRTARRRLLLYMSSITLGVAALVAIDGFSMNVIQTVRTQARTLVGGDVQLTARRPFPAPVETLLDSLQRAGTPNVRTTTFPAMALLPRTGGTRFVQVRGVGMGYPWYGRITTAPPDALARLQRDRVALVDQALLAATGGRVGDTLHLGNGRFVIAGTLQEVPGAAGIAATLGPRVFVAQRWLPETQLLGVGATAEYSALLRLPGATDPQAFAAPLRRRLEAQQMSVRTVTETERAVTSATATLSSFIGIVGLVALLLGGIGVASGIRAFVARKIDTVAVLRCLGATGAEVLVIYAAQAALMGFVGALIGAALGVAIQFALPAAVGPFLPLGVAVRVELRPILSGLLLGGWIALLFSLRALLPVRRISPLQTLRRTDDAELLRTRRRDPASLLIDLALVASFVAVALLRATTQRQGWWIAVATGGVLVALVASAAALTFVARRVLHVGWPYVVRQGVANVYRPANQTRAVVLSLGFGAFLVTTLYLVQTNLLHALRVDAAGTGANAVFFDVQDDQNAPLAALIRGRGYRVVQDAPVVAMRIATINGRDVATLSADTGTGGARRARWALRREYRSTYRDSLVHGERVVAGHWFRGGPPSPSTTGIGEVSLERGVADELHVTLGDTITWDVQGVQIPTRVTSVREVTWTRFEPNFFAVFPPSVLRDAPTQYVILARVPGAASLAALQRDVVREFPNVSSLDLSLILTTVNRIVDRASTAIRFLALFSLVMGIPVLVSAVAATRRERVREGVLLKTLGATRAQLLRILATEYALLGVLGSLTGFVLAMGGGWALVHYVFHMPYAVAVAPAVAIAVAMLAITMTVGLLAGRDVFRETAMTALRAEL